MTNWKEYKIGDLVTFQRGHDLPRTQMSTGIYPVAGSNSIIGYHNQFTTKAPGITIGRSGNIGNPQLHTMDFWAHNTVLYVKEFKKVDPVFFYYLLKTLDFSQLNSGSAVPSLNRNFIHPFTVSVPDDLPTQTAIAEILSSLDDKIELNNKINQELEDLAQTLFRQWFIDFEFPNENGEPYKSSGGEMIDSELGEIPKGWQVVQLEQLCDRMNSGGTPSTRRDDYYNGSIFWYSTKELQDSFLFSSDRTISDKGLANSSAKIFPVNTVVMAIYAAPTVGRLGILSQDAAFNQAALGFVAKSEIGYEYIFLLLKHLRSDLNNLANGAAQQNLNVRIVKNYPTFLATRNLLKCFQEVISPIFTMMKNNQVENIELKTLRDTLLPKLISGELRVSELTAQNA